MSIPTVELHVVVSTDSDSSLVAEAYKHVKLESDRYNQADFPRYAECQKRAWKQDQVSLPGQQGFFKIRWDKSAS
jgi:hypothetical protein